MRHVGKERTEGDDELDTELGRQRDDLAAERAPARVRLDPEQKYGVALDAGDPGVVEDVLGPVDLAREALLEADLRTDRLEVVELLGIDVSEPGRLPALGQEAGRERCSLGAVVPTPERCDEDWLAQRRTELDAEVAGDRLSLVLRD